MTLPPPKVCRLICRLHAMIGSSVANEAATALGKLSELLAKHGLTWNDLPTIFSAIHTDNDPSSSHSAASQAATDPPTVNVLDLVLRLLELHIAITAEERMAVALWILHSYVFDRFPITPRLHFSAPYAVAEKPRLFVLLELLVASGFRTDNVTAAAIYHHLDHNPYITLLVDEEGREPRYIWRCRFARRSSTPRGVAVAVRLTASLAGARPRKFTCLAPLASLRQARSRCRFFHGGSDRYAAAVQRNSNRAA